MSARGILERLLLTLGCLVVAVLLGCSPELWGCHARLGVVGLFRIRHRAR